MTNAPQNSAKPAPLLHFGHPDSHIPMFDPPDTPGKPLSHSKVIILFLVAAAVAVGGWGLEHFAGESHTTPNVAAGWMIPFALLLAGIAAMPFIAKHFWEHNYQWVSIALGALVTAYYCFGVGTPNLGGPRAMAHSFADFISFICLLGSLFIVSGGILIRVRRKASPMVNVSILLIGAIIANIFGTTGASMLLIRPFLRINKGHLRPYHIVFFIFSISNLGGCLTPIGDPPLFLGYLKGVPFWWVAEHCWQPWALAIGCVLALFFAFEMIHHKKSPRAPQDPNDLGPAISIFGAGNLIYIAMILAAVFLPPPYRELLMIAAACASLWTTPNRIHRENVFNFAPIREVALLFVGIFATMVPALNYLSTHANDPALTKYLQTPGQFYFASGALSSVLDNAPTYMTFLETEVGKIDPKLKEMAFRIAKTKGQDSLTPADEAELLAHDPDRFEKNKATLKEALATLHHYHGDKVAAGTLNSGEVDVGFLIGRGPDGQGSQLNWYVIAISLGSVFFGAMTYIGNGPNFMVKSIAENFGGGGVPCPSFFGYIFRYSLPLLLPILILVWFVFLRSHTGH